MARRPIDRRHVQDSVATLDQAGKGGGVGEIALDHSGAALAQLARDRGGTREGRDLVSPRAKRPQESASGVSRGAGQGDLQSFLDLPNRTEAPTRRPGRLTGPV